MVAPVRWATPGTEVDCAIQPWLSPSATIQSTSTPPPCPPMASTAMVTGLAGSSLDGGIMAFMGVAPSGESDAALVAPALQEADHRRAQPRDHSVEHTRIVDDVGPIERRAQHG